MNSLIFLRYYRKKNIAEFNNILQNSNNNNFLYFSAFSGKEKITEFERNRNFMNIFFDLLHEMENVQI